MGKKTNTFFAAVAVLGSIGGVYAISQNRAAKALQESITALKEQNGALEASGQALSAENNDLANTVLDLKNQLEKKPEKFTPGKVHDIALAAYAQVYNFQNKLNSTSVLERPEGALFERPPQNYGPEVNECIRIREALESLMFDPNLSYEDIIPLLEDFMELQNNHYKIDDIEQPALEPIHA